MKTLATITLILFSSVLFAQKETDTTTIDFGETKVIIVDNAKKDSTSAKKDKTFNAWTGIELGFNMLRTSDGSLDMPKELNYMELDYAKSLTWNFNFADINWDWLDVKEKYQYNKYNVGIISGIGLSFKNYTLKNDYTLLNVDDSTFGFRDTSINYTKNKLRSFHLRMPAMLQFYTMKKKGSKVRHRFYIAAGVVGGLRLSSSYKLKYKVDGEEKKDKQRDDYNMSSFNLDAEVRVGFGSLNLFASYGLTPLFEDNRGPELYPLTLGMSLTKSF